MQNRWIVSVQTAVTSDVSRIIETTERYTIKCFTNVLLEFGRVIRTAALLRIKKHIKIIAGIIRTPEMAFVHKEMAFIHEELQLDADRTKFKMCSFPLDNAPRHRKLRCMQYYVSRLYASTLLCVTCRKVDVFFLDEILVGKVHQYSSTGDILPDKGSWGFFLCILIATEEDEAFSGSLSLSGATDTCKFVYHMSAGDTCLLFGMSCISFP